MRQMILGLLFILLIGCEGNSTLDTNVLTTSSTTTIPKTTTTTLAGIPFTTLQQGKDVQALYTGHVTAQLNVSHSANEWYSFWNSIDNGTYTQYFTGLPYSSVNFSENAIVAVLDDLRSSGGYKITINRIEPTSTGITVHATQEIPGDNCVRIAVFTLPFHNVTIPAFTGEAILDLKQAIVDCVR